MIIFHMRSSALFAVLFTITLVAYGDQPTVESLPPAVANTLRAEAGTGTVRNIETFQWGDATIYKIGVEQEGQRYLELQIADTGRLVRIDQPETNESDEEDDVMPAPSPSASPRGK
jgi:hypothetical protein